MDALRVIKKDGVTTYVHVSTAPVPHSITRIAKESGNYGLADQARMEHPHLVCKEGEVPGPVVPIPFGEDVVLPVGRGRGRGRSRLLSIPLVEMKHETLRNEPAIDPKNFEDVAGMFLDGIGEPETKPDVIRTPPELKEDDFVASMSARAESIRVVSRPCAPPEPATVPVKSSKASKTKANGYILFVRHIARQNGVTGPICTLMTQFDAQWKVKATLISTRIFCSLISSSFSSNR